MKDLIIKIIPLIKIILCIVFFSLLACDHNSNTPFEKGSVTFNVVWKDSPTMDGDFTTAALDCNAFGVETVMAEIYDNSGSWLADDGPNDCLVGGSTIKNVPVGSDRTLVILAKDESDDIVYRGEKTGINITAGETTDAGEVEAGSFIPELLAPIDGQTVESVSFSWQSPSGSYEFQIQVAIDSTFATTPIDTTTTNTVYTPSGLSYGQTYYWRVKAKDTHANESAWSEVWSFTVPTGPGVAPSTPTGVSATAEDGQITISWDSVSWATSYNIYWATWPGVSKTNYEGVVYDATSPYTHTGLTNGIPYYYVVTAENSYGESGESSEVSATPASDFYVSIDGNDAMGDGTQLHPWRTISYALSQAKSPGVTIHVGPGTYDSNLEGFPLILKDGVSISGAGMDLTIIDADLQTRVFYGTNLSSLIQLDNLQIREGEHYEHGDGGGLYGTNLNLEIIDCKFVSNETYGCGDGGGIYLSNSEITITGCVFQDNKGGSKGGGIYLNNTTAFIDHCAFIQNGESCYGGGLYGGTAIAISGSGSSGSIISSCTISRGWGNHSTVAGAILFEQGASPLVRNCIFFENEDHAIYESDDISDPVVKYNLFHGNGNVYMDEGSVIYNDVSTLDAVVEGCSNNQACDPMFVGGTPFDYHLTEGSCAVDTGDPSSTLDPDDTIADQGCYYFPH